MAISHVAGMLALAAGTVLLAVSSPRAQDARGAVAGVVSDAAGKPVAGAFVKVKNDERRLTFMVISREQGRFEAKDLPPGQYRVQAIGAGFQSEWFDRVTVNAGDSAKAGLSLTLKQGPTLPPAWPQRIPETEVLKASKDPKHLPGG